MKDDNSRRPLGPPWYLLLGHLIGLLPDKLGFLQSSTTKYGDVMNLTLGSRTYLLNDPDDIRHVLETNHLNYTKTRRLTSERGKRLSGEGLLTSSGSPAIDQRRVLAPLFWHSTIARLSEVMVNCTTEMMTRWQPGEVLDISQQMRALTLRVMGKSLFSIDFLEAPKFADAMRIRRRYHQYVLTSPLPLPDTVPTHFSRQYRRAMNDIDETIYDLIRARRQGSTLPEDLLSMLLQAKDKDGVIMNDKQVRDEALTLATTGFETIGLALTWTWYLISRNLDVEEELAAELKAVLGGRPPNYNDVPNLRYTDMIFSESMRLYPPTWIFQRVAQYDDPLPSGFNVPAGSKLYLCPYVTHRDPRYFSDPARFDPKRFAESTRKSRPKFAYFPFGGGPRVCLGQGFAMLEGILVLACVAQRFRLELIADQRIVPQPGLTLFPKYGIQMRVKSN